MVHIAPVQTHTNNVVIMFFEKPKGSPFFVVVVGFFPGHKNEGWEAVGPYLPWQGWAGGRD